MKITNKRVTKAMLQAAADRREKMFEGLSPVEVRQLVPVNKAYIYEYENSGIHGWGIFVPECILCGGRHKHGQGELGEYSIHCDNDGEIYPFKYNLQLDMTDEDNIRLAEKYGVQLVQ